MVLLSNRVHPTRRNEQIRLFRPLIHDLICRELLKKLGGKDPDSRSRFLLGEIAAALEIQACTQSSKPDIAQFFDNGFDGCPGGGVSRAFDGGVGPVGDFARIASAATRLTRMARVEVPVVWVP